MKKWLIILSSILGIGFILSAILAGHVYYQDLQYYTDYDKQVLEIEQLKNIYINSSIPIQIHPTSDTPYVEFNQSFIDLIGSAPEYELNVVTKGENTYIELNKIKDIPLPLGIKENKAQLSIYLPRRTINRLIITNDQYFNYKHNKQVINLENININELIANMNETEFILDGKYEKIRISAPEGKINLKSNVAVQFMTQGNLEQYLMGEFDKINIKNNSRDIIIDSEQTNIVEVQSNYSNISLKGKYNNIKFSGEHNTVDIESESICKIYTDGYNNFISGNGAFNIMSLSEENSQIEIQTTVIPNKLNFGGDTANSIISLTLPSNIPGLTIRYLNNDTQEVNEIDYDEDYQEEDFNVISDFDLEQIQKNRREFTFNYGNGSCQILINGNQENRLEIINGVYSSKV